MPTLIKDGAKPLAQQTASGLVGDFGQPKPFTFRRSFDLHDSWQRQEEDLDRHSLRLNPYEDDFDALLHPSASSIDTYTRTLAGSRAQQATHPAKRARTSADQALPEAALSYVDSLLSNPSPDAAGPFLVPLLQDDGVDTGPSTANQLPDPPDGRPTSSPFRGSLPPSAPPLRKSPLRLEPDSFSGPSGLTLPPSPPLPLLPLPYKTQPAPSIPPLSRTLRSSPTPLSPSPLLPNVALLSPLVHAALPSRIPLASSVDSPAGVPVPNAGADEGPVSKPQALQPQPQRPLKRPRSPQSLEDVPLPAESPAKRLPNKRGFSKQGQGAKQNKARKGRHFQAAEGDVKTARALGLHERSMETANVVKSSFDIATDALVSKSGWMGRAVKKATRAELSAAISNGTIWAMIACFTLIHHIAQQASVGIDAPGRTFLYQSQQVPWVADLFGDIYGQVQDLLASGLNLDVAQKKDAKGVRGPHHALLLGHYRQYSDWPTLTGFHSRNYREVEAFRTAESMRRLTSLVEGIARGAFPGFATRFLRSVEWYRDLAAKGKGKNERKKARAAISPLFGLFWNFCFNICHAGQTRVHCLPHADTKNIVGVCVIVVYQKPGHRFNHRKRSWLVLWEAKVIVEMPPWTVTAYPSSLLLHFNIDIEDFRFVSTEGGLPTLENSEEFGPDDSSGRGSIVYFNEASMYQSSETGFSTLRAAKIAGVDTDRDYGKDAAAAFARHGVCQRIG